MDAAPSTPALTGSLAAIVLALSTWSGTAGAVQPAEPNGLLIPQPITADAPYQTSPGSLTLQSLFVSRGEIIDWQMDATTSPAVFSPNCGFTGTLVLRGGGCKVDFGWYNVDLSSNIPPPDSEIHVLVPQTDPIFNNTFQPQVGSTGSTFSASSIQSDPNYKGGLIGFAFKGNPSQACSQTHFSEQRLNVTCTNCTPSAPWITALIWKSTKTANAYYVGFEDLPMAPTNFGGFPGQQYTNDGDFNDFVYFITGINCQGAGQPCDTGLMGVCAAGLTDCTAGATMVCQQQGKASPETCDGIDNDCNGMVDDGPNLCPTGEVCEQGKCVHSCTSGEFPCSDGLACKDGYCVDPACLTVTCAAGQVCHGGTCSGPCDGVVCPKPQVCQPGLSQCVDPCAGVTCGTGQVCQAGACVLNCACAGCGTGQECEPTSGSCVDTGCAGKTCGNGMVCTAGTCVDACAGAVCPGGATCMNGQCGMPLPGAGSSSSGGFDGGSSFVGASGSTTGGNGGAQGAGGAPQGTGGGFGTGGVALHQGVGCNCRLSGDTPEGFAAGVPALLLALGARRRRRRGPARHARG